MKHINLKIPDETFYSLLELKAKYKTDNWNDLMTKIARIMNVVSTSAIPDVKLDEKEFLFCSRKTSDFSRKDIPVEMPVELELTLITGDSISCNFKLDKILNDSRKKNDL